MVWKVVDISDTGTSIKFGANDTDKINKLFNAVADVDLVDINSSTTIRDNKFKLRNPANTFSYTFRTGAISANRDLNVPVITGTDTLATLGLAQTWSAAQKFDTYTEVKEIAEPSSPASGYVRLYVDSTNKKLSVKHSDGTVVVLE